MRYVQHVDGETWVRMANYPAHRISCCDCGLVHDLEFREVDGYLEFKATINDRATAQKRKATILKIQQLREGLK